MTCGSRIFSACAVLTPNDQLASRGFTDSCNVPNTRVHTPSNSAGTHFSAGQRLQLWLRKTRSRFAAPLLALPSSRMKSEPLLSNCVALPQRCHSTFRNALSRAASPSCKAGSPWKNFAASAEVSLRRDDLVDCAVAVVANIKLVAGVLPEGGRIFEAEVAYSRREQLRRDVSEVRRPPAAVVVEGEDSPNAATFRSKIVTEHIGPSQRRYGVAAINVATGNTLPCRVRVVVNRVDAACRSCSAYAAGRSLYRSLAQPPLVVRRAWRA